MYIFIIDSILNHDNSLKGLVVLWGREYFYFPPYLHDKKIGSRYFFRLLYSDEKF